MFRRVFFFFFFFFAKSTLRHDTSNVRDKFGTFVVMYFIFTMQQMSSDFNVEYSAHVGSL